MPIKVQEFLKGYRFESAMSGAVYKSMVERTHCITTEDLSMMKFAPPIICGVSLICLIILLIRSAASAKAMKKILAGHTAPLNEDAKAGTGQNNENKQADSYDI